MKKIIKNDLKCGIVKDGNFYETSFEPPIKISKEESSDFADYTYMYLSSLSGHNDSKRIEEINEIMTFINSWSKKEN